MLDFCSSIIDVLALSFSQPFISTLYFYEVSTSKVDTRVDGSSSSKLLHNPGLPLRVNNAIRFQL